MTHFDTIVIGSGMGGLATASLLAQIGKQRVLVLESHFKLGGFLHSFRRHKYEWDPGFHYAGEMHKGSLTRRCMDLVTGGRVKWHKLGSRFEKIMFPEGVFDIPDCPKRYQLELCERFPHETKNIKQYFSDVNATKSWSQRWFYSRALPEPLASMISMGRGLVTQNTQAYFDSRFDDPLLKGLLSAQWGDYGTPPGESAFGIHGIVCADFHHGGYYPIGGSQRIADCAVAVIERLGGRCLASHPVEEIIIQSNRAIGVRVKNKNTTQEYFASNIVSNAGLSTTFNKLVPAEFGQKERSRAAKAERGPSSIVVYLGLNDDPRKHGFQDCNYWMFESIDHEHNTKSQSGGLFLSFGSLRNPGQEPHTAQIITFSDESQWSNFFGTQWKNRGEEYERKKREWADSLIDFADARLPGLKKLVAYSELSSPLTVESFTGHPYGQIYGRACSPSRLGEQEGSIGTSVKRLYLTGTDVTVPGVNSALMVGVMTAAKLLGPVFGMPRVLASAAFNAANVEGRNANRTRGSN